MYQHLQQIIKTMFDIDKDHSILINLVQSGKIGGTVVATLFAVNIVKDLNFLEVVKAWLQIVLYFVSILAVVYQWKKGKTKNDKENKGVAA